ncbi:aminodeoxychorismate synthase component I [Luteolibacter pohnpeiensis]|uniref:Aminodeoxychorismate synthase component I n=1 Tax=Luteolibacter pohnpeiensis TaxID=454153 RepID=A0A934S7J0_9BACT|nr:aminodeoxychorismate synthase component I [Luteolibacter pohnpeiensis]MBK1882735.1 aminodeoxychorismate synthase component I [Luteolibacter pohnpeiensis]
MNDRSAPTLARQPRLEGMTPLEVAARLRHLDGLVFFDSVSQSAPGGKGAISVIAARPIRVLRGKIDTEPDRQALRQALAEGPQVARDHGFPLGGLCGWVDYEGQFVFGDYREMLVHCHEDDSWWEAGRLSQHLAEPSAAKATLGETRTLGTQQAFIDGVKKVKDWIASGDIYQVNLSQAFEVPVHGGSLFGLYETLREMSPAPMAAWLSLDDTEVLSSSPETFLRMSGRGIETKPIKGTRPRFANVDEDLRSAYELQTSAKEIAELVMITDLLRNDLGQVSEFGSVAVTEMLRLETLAQVHHLVSTVTGRLRPEIDAIAALAACFPGGSITGAPKKRAMEIIREIEGKPRGIYCGAIGWFGYNGESAFNIAIRTIIRKGEKLIYQVGAGIVADSDPQKEYEETLHKAAGIRLAIDRWQSKDG